MRKLIKFILSFSVAMMVFFCFTHTWAGFENFEDVTGHWAEEALRMAYNEDYLIGVDNSMLPNGNLTLAQALTILNRVLGAQIEADITALELPEGAWYRDEVAKAFHLGLISSAKRNYDAILSRQDAFKLLAEAFAIVETEPDMTLLKEFSDSSKIKAENLRAMATLVSHEIIQGYEGKLNADQITTRAEFMTAVFRVVSELITPPNTDDDSINGVTDDSLEPGNDSVSNDNPKLGDSPEPDDNDTAPETIRLSRSVDEITGTFNNGVIYRGNAKWYSGRFEKGLWFDCSTTDIDLRDVTVSSAVIRSHVFNSIIISDDSKIDRLTLASQSGDVKISPDKGTTVKTLVVGTGGGRVTVEGIKTIEITGTGRDVIIQDDAGLILVSGRLNTVRIMSGVQVDKIKLLDGASGSRVMLSGHVDEIDIDSKNITLDGDGSANIITTYYPDTNLYVAYDKHFDGHDYGIANAELKLNHPASLPVDQMFNASLTVENVKSDLLCNIKWYVDDKEIVNTSAKTGGNIPGLTHKFKYAYNMPTVATIKAILTYESKQGEKQERIATAEVKIDNHSIEHYAKDVLEKVTLGYKGDFTLEWAQENDLLAFEKELWVNAKGYSSNSEYLLWINLAFQRVNIFEGKTGDWKLIRSCIVGTGAPGRGTATGVTTTTYKQRDGWTTHGYTCKPVVRFRSGTGYAFHSRLYYPRSDQLIDSRIGFPISNGCIRMYDDDIWFIYDNVPEGTTVVVH